jgi:hypothetical protein
MDKMLEYLQLTAIAAGFDPDPKNPVEIIGALIGVALSFLGIIFLVLTIYAGFTWMTAGGNETKVLRAKATLRNSVIGLIIVVSAYSITRFVFNSLA